MTIRHYRTCTLCEAICGLVIETEGDRVHSIRGDEEDPFSRGYICPKAAALKDLHEDPDRLRTPLRRDGARFVPMAWDQAYDLVAREVTRLQKAHGRSSVALYLGNPTVHNHGSMLYGPSFMAALHTRSRFSATSVDQLPHMLVSYWMFGHQLLLPIPDIDRTDYMLVLGANPAVSNGSLMTAPGASDRLRAILARNGRVVVLDPRKSETAARASEHHFVKPGSDALFLLGVLHTLFAEGLTKPGRLEPMLKGIDHVHALVAPFTPERVAAPVGIAAEVIRRLAREFARAERAVCYGRIGVCTQDFGALSVWLINLLNIVTGNLDRVGGAMFTTPAVDLLKLPLGRGHYGAYKSRVRGLPEFGGELPMATLAEEIETEGQGQIRGLITSAGNPVLSAPNGARLERALPKLEFMASIDFYLNETTRHAHVILPPTGPLEHDHYDVALHMLAVRNTAKYSPAVFPRKPEARHDWEILNELTWRLAPAGLARALARTQAEVMKRLKPQRIIDLLLRIGPYGDRFLPLRQGLSRKALEEQPHGVDLGALAPRLPERLFTPDKKIDLAPALLLKDLSRLGQSLSKPQQASSAGAETPGASTSPEGELTLIGRRQLRSNNSWMHNSLRLVKGPARCTLQMNPADAHARGLSDGELVQIRSRVGSVQAPLEVTEALMPGVVSLPHGWGHTRPGTALRVASEHAGASINDLTDETRVDALSGTASFSGVPVQVERAPFASAVSEMGPPFG